MTCFKKFLLALTLLTSLLLSITAPESHLCPPKCTCKLQQDGLIAKCEGISEYDLPSLKNLSQENIVALTVSNCDLKIIDFSIFPTHLRRLLTLSIHNCTTEYIKKIDLKPLFESVTNLSIQNTSIDLIREGLLSYFPKLEHISLVHNNIDRIYRDAFINSSSLRSINLSYNKIVEIDEAAFDNLSKLEVVDLSHNQLEISQLCKRMTKQLPGVICLGVEESDCVWPTPNNYFHIIVIALLTMTILNSILHFFQKPQTRVAKVKFKDLYPMKTERHSDILTYTADTLRTLNETLSHFQQQINTNTIIGQIQFLHINKLAKNVFRGSILNDGRKVAIKKSRIMSHDKFPQELDILLKLTESGADHDNVIKYICTETKEQHRYIALYPLCDTTLMVSISDTRVHKYLKEGKNSCFVQLAKGLQYIHDRGVQHRDIKPKNILLKFEGDIPTFIISDFDLGHLTGKESRQRVRYGTIGWVAPELWGQKKREPTVDIFSLGCVFYFALTRGKRHPFGKLEDMGECQINISKDTTPQLADEDMTLEHNFRREQAKDLIRQMVQFDASQRPNATKVLDHPLFWDDSEITSFYLEFGNHFDDMESRENTDLREYLRNESSTIFPNNNWKKCIPDQVVLRDVKERKKDDICSLLKVIRDKITHWDKIKRSGRNELKLIYQSKGGVAQYYNELFPRLLLCAYYAKKRMSLQ